VIVYYESTIIDRYHNESYYETHSVVVHRHRGMAASNPLHRDARPHRASQAPIVCTASLHATPPFQATKSKALLVLSGRGAAVALVAARRDLPSLPFAHALRAAIQTKMLDGRTRTVLARAPMSSDL
jgi:hypothetical protein